MKVFEYKGSWYYIFDGPKHPVTGKRRQIKKGGFKTEKAAERAGIRAKVEAENGLLAVTERITFGDMVKMWLKDYENRGHVKMSSVISRKNLFNVWLKHFKDTQLKKMTLPMIQNVMNELRPNYSDRTLSLLKTVLKMMFKKAKELGYVTSDPIEFLYVPKKRKSVEEIEDEPIQNKYLEKDVLKQFLDSAKNYGIDHDYVMFRLLAYTGIRIGEALALKWTDIDFNERSIRIQRRISHHSNNLSKYEIDTPKTDTSKRIIPIDKDLGNLLNELQTYQGWFKKKYPQTADFGFVFINYHLKGKYLGFPVSQKNVRVRIERLTKISEIDIHITPHMFRHTHTSLLAEAGVDLVTIMERLGHKDDDVTKNIYLHITQSLKQEAVHKFEKLMNDL